MFESLSDKLKRTLKNLRGEGVLTQSHVDAALREIRLALLEADVNYKVAKDFIASVKEKAEGQQVWQELKPSEQVVKIVFGGGFLPIRMNRPCTTTLITSMQSAALI